MTKRRQVLIGLGAIGSAGGLGVSTGAFTSTEVERSVSVAVADDAEAYLGLITDDDDVDDSITHNDFTETQSDHDIVKLDFNSITFAGKGDGISRNAEYEFDDVFRLRNQGTQDIEVTISTIDSLEDGDITVEFYADGDSNDSIDEDGVVIEEGGSDAEIGVKIDSGDVDIDTFNEDTTIYAEPDE